MSNKKVTFVHCAFKPKMKERIQQFIDYKGISAGELATELDVQRSNISHILNGRNKPGAAFIEKFLLTFPDLNARWLLTGLGNMINDVNTIPSSSLSNEFKVKNDVKHDISSSSPDKPKHEQAAIPPSISNTNKKIIKVVLLFSDGTFSSYKSGN